MSYMLFYSYSGMWLTLFTNVLHQPLLRVLRLAVFEISTDSHDPQNMLSDVTLTLEAVGG
jgi:hypothetical protein